MARRIGNAAGSNQTNLSDDGMGTNLAWSPDGQKIAFTYDDLKSPTPNFYIMNADGSNQTRLTDTQEGWEGIRSLSEQGKFAR